MAFLKSLNIDKIIGAVEAGAKSVQEGVSNLNIEEAVQGAKSAAAAGVDKIGGAVSGALSKSANEEESAGLKGFISLLWCLASVDGVISEKERQTLGELARAFDEGYEAYAEELESDCLARIKANSDEFGWDNAMKIEAREIIASMGVTTRDAKLLCWNLLALANSDGVEQPELDFIRFIGKECGLDPAVFEEFKNYGDAVGEIEAACNALKSSNRPYAEIEPLINEFAERQRIILDAAQALIMDE